MSLRALSQGPWKLWVQRGGVHSSALSNSSRPRQPPFNTSNHTLLNHTLLATALTSLDAYRSVLQRLSFQRASSSLQLERAAMMVDASGEGRGTFIVVEGLDRSGKTTQCNLLKEFLQQRGEAVELWHFPDRSTAVGKMINDYLQQAKELDDNAVHLLFSANRWEKRKQLEECLKKNVSVIVDRYSFSGVAFSAAKGREWLDFTWCQQSDVGLPAPDLVLYLTVDPKVAEARGGYGEERYEKVDFQRKVAACFDQLQDPTWRRVDASGSVEEVAGKLQQLVSDALLKCKMGQPLARISLRP